MWALAGVVSWMEDGMQQEEWDKGDGCALISYENVYRMGGETASWGDDHLAASSQFDTFLGNH